MRAAFVALFSLALAACGGTTSDSKGGAGGSGGGSGDAGDAGSNCTAAPAQDSQCGNGKPPHFYACQFQYAQPSGCVLLNIGNVTDTYCCP